MKEEKEWDQTADADTVEGSIERVMREEIMETCKHLKIEKAPGLSEVYAEMTPPGGDVGIKVTRIIATNPWL